MPYLSEAELSRLMRREVVPDPRSYPNVHGYWWADINGRGQWAIVYVMQVTFALDRDYSLRNFQIIGSVTLFPISSVKGKWIGPIIR